MVACGGRHVELSTIVQWRWLARWREVECGVRGWGGLHQRLAAVTDCSPAQPRRTATQHWHKKYARFITYFDDFTVGGELSARCRETW